MEQIQLGHKERAWQPLPGCVSRIGIVYYNPATDELAAEDHDRLIELPETEEAEFREKFSNLLNSLQVEYEMNQSKKTR